MAEGTFTLSVDLSEEEFADFAKELWEFGALIRRESKPNVVTVSMPSGRFSLIHDIIAMYSESLPKNEGSSSQ